MTHSILLRRIVLVFAGLVAGIALYYYLTMATTLRVAVGPVGSEQAIYVNVIGKALKDGRTPVRLVPLITGGSTESRTASCYSPSARGILDVAVAQLRSDQTYERPL
jgi:hypothetical protein